MSDGPTITVGEGAWPFVIGGFGWQFDEFGFIVDEDDDLVLDTVGRPIQRHQLGGIAPDDNGDPCPMKNDISAIVASVHGEMLELPVLPEQDIQRRTTLYEVGDHER